MSEQKFDFGMIGLATSLACIGVAAQIGRYVLISRVLSITPGNIATHITAPIAIGAVTWLVASSAIFLLPESAHLMRFLVGLVVVLIAFSVGTVWADRQFRFGVVSFVLQRIPARFQSARFGSLVHSTKE